MPLLSFISWSTTGDSASSRIVDLAVVDPDGAGDAAAMLYSITRYGGQIGAWAIGTTELALVETTTTGRADAAGAIAGFDLILAGPPPAILAGSGVGGALRQIGLDSTGFGDSASLGTQAALPADLIHGVTVDLGAAGQVVYGGLLNAAGIGMIRLTAAGAIDEVRVIADTPTAYADRISALATATVDGQRLLFTACDTGNGITAWAIGPTGDLTQAANLGADRGLWISQPTALAAVEMAGAAWLVIAAAGSSTLTVARVSGDGRMTITDHLMDDLASRFGGVSAMVTVSHQGQVYVLAGGADDGITLLRLLPDGRLVVTSVIEDSATMGLQNISAIAARSTASGIEVFVTSSVEAGITRFFLATGIAGTQAQLPVASAGTGMILVGTDMHDDLIGTDTNDSIHGGAGDDMLIDGAGADTLSGGAGADHFIMSADGETDLILDFTLGQDRVDLTAWGRLRDISQLSLAATETGFRIQFGDEVLLVNTATGTPVDLSALTNPDIIGPSRMPILPPEALLVSGTSGRDTLSGDAGDDTLYGLGGDDNIIGQQGADLISGDDGNDTIFGGASTDTISGGTGNDSLLGDGGNDILYGGSGRDFLDGGTGNDWLYSDSGDSSLYGGAGDDHIYGGTGADILDGGDGHDAIWGGARADSIYGGSGDDSILGGTGNDLLYGGDGNDTLSGEAGNDSLYGGDGDDVLSDTTGTNFLYGGAGNDRLSGGPGSDRLDGGPGADTMSGSKGNDTYVVDNKGDVIQGEVDTAMSGIDTVESWIDYTLRTNLEILRLQGTENIAGKGNASGNTLVGNSGRNRLEGLAGNDTLLGGAGADTLIGGSGTDRLSGEAGRDTFVFLTALDSGTTQSTRDMITDFTHDQDIIDLSAIDANPYIDGDQAFSFLGNDFFDGRGSASAGQLRYYHRDAAWNIIEIDIDGDGHADMQIHIAPTNYMTATDFIL